MRFFLPLLFCLAAAAGPVLAQGRPQPVDGYAAEVNGRIITVGDVIDRVRASLLRLRDQYQGRELAEKQREVFEEGLERMIEQKLMLARYEKLGASIPDTAVRERTDAIVRERFDNDREQLRRVLHQAGKTELQWEDEIREQLIAQSMIAQFVRSRIHVSPREIREAYDGMREEFREEVELKLRAISFRPSTPEREDERQRKIASVQLRLNQGEDFAELAREVSEGPSANRGGDEGWVKPDGLPPPLREALSDLLPGDRSPLIDTPVQSYIFLVEDRRGGAPMDLVRAQPLLEARISEQKYAELYEVFMEGLRREFQVRRFNPDISAVTGNL